MTPTDTKFIIKHLSSHEIQIYLYTLYKFMLFINVMYNQNNFINNHLIILLVVIVLI